MNYDLFGSHEHAMSKLRDSIDRTLNVKLELHHSWYLGGDYYSLKFPAVGGLRLLCNRYEDEDGEGFIEPVHAEYELVVQVETTTQANDICDRLKSIEGLEFLQHEIF